MIIYYNNKQLNNYYITVGESDSHEPVSEFMDTSNSSTTSTVTTVSSGITVPASNSGPLIVATDGTQSTSSSGSHGIPSSSLPLVDIAKDKADKAAQPVGITYPYRMFGSTKRSFQASWYTDSM